MSAVRELLEEPLDVVDVDTKATNTTAPPAAARDALGETRFAVAWALGQTIGADQAITQALQDNET